MSLSGGLNQREYDKFIRVGSGVNADLATDATANQSVLFGISAGGTGLAIKVVDDGTGLGKISSIPE
jgi:hypothetical protein